MLSTRIDIQRKDGELYAHKVAAGAKIWQGAHVWFNTAGYLAPVGVGTGKKYAGVAVEDANNTSGADGGMVCRVYKRGNFLLNGSGFSMANVGDSVYASADDQVSLTSGASKAIVGVIIDCISSTQVEVKMLADSALATS